MEFRLLYEGKLASNGTPKEKQLIRRCFHPQLKRLWETHPQLYGERGRLNVNYKHLVKDTILEEKKPFIFAPLVTPRLSLTAQLDIVLLRASKHGGIIFNSGDIDNQIKTLLDALRMPHHVEELVKGDNPLDGEEPFHCLLQDDCLVTALSITTDYLLKDGAEKSHVATLIHVTTKYVPSQNAQVNSTSF